MKILVFGKNGQLARSLEALESDFCDLSFVGRELVDLTKRGRAKDVILDLRPDLIINTAAYTAVDSAEDNIDEAFSLNADAPGEIAMTAKAIDAPFLHLSTDYVFGRQDSSLIKVKDLRDPINIYGKSKMSGENFVISSGCKYVILRCSWIFSEYGNNFVKTMLELGQNRSEINVVSDQFGGPTYAGEIARLCLEISKDLVTGKLAKEVLHFCCAPYVSWAEFAESIFETAGLDVKVNHINSADYSSQAARPLNSRLDCSLSENFHGIARPSWLPGLKNVINEVRGV